jgi:hypothetical protein
MLARCRTGAGEEEPMSELDDLLSRLPSRAETQQPLTFDGRALSRDDSHIHMATTSGVIAIPLAEIEAVRFIAGQGGDLVSVDVRNPDRIQYIRRVSPALMIGGGSGVFRGPGEFGDSPTGIYADSTTVTGGRADATDDTIWIGSGNDDVIT